jgi:spermidine dehydrogenase
MAKIKKGQPLSAKISRRDFVNGTLVGAGAALLSSVAPVFASTRKPITPPQAQAQTMPVEMVGEKWNGFAGVGDYAKSNGNVASTRDAAHLIRDGFTEELMESIEDTGEDYDMVIIGGGFSGIGAAYEFNKKYGDTKKCLIIENHPVFGGEAKQNEFDVDGYKLYGPQASNDFGAPDKDSESLITDIYKNTGLPFKFTSASADPKNSKLRVPLEHFYGMLWEEERYDTGYFMGADAKEPWIINPRKDRLARMPWSEEFKAELNKALDDDVKPYEGDDVNQWLDTMTYKDLLEKKMGFSPKVTDYMDPVLAISMGGVCSDVYSAYSAKLLEMPGTGYQYRYDPKLTDEDVGVYSYPGGNTAIFRHIIKYLLPDAIEGKKDFEDIMFNAINFEALDRPENPLNIRLNSTAIDVRHEGDADTADHVQVTYAENGKVKRVKAKTVVVSIGGWVAKHIISDLPDPIVDAYSQFYHSPVLVVNVALRNWHFLEKLGIAAGRIFDGFGDFWAIRKPMETGDRTQPFDPDKPTVMTFYVPLTKSGTPIFDQGSLARYEMLSKSYADYETEITDQMTAMFGDHGFDAERDIAGIVLNRWGHAYISPQPGFHFDRDGKKSPINTVKEGYGRIRFGHSELSGYMSHTRALNQGSRAAKEAMEKI